MSRWSMSSLGAVLAVLGCGGATLDPAGSDATEVGPPPSFSSVVAEHAFPGEIFHQVWGTDDELWILGQPERDASSSAPAGPPSPLPNCAPDRYAAKSVLRRKTRADFELVSQPASTTLTSLHGSGPSDVWLVGLGGAAFRFDGVAWQTHDVRTAQGLAFDDVTCSELSLRSVFARSPRDVWVVGHIYESPLGPALILHYDGQSWKRHAIDAGDGLFDVWAASESDVWVVGSSGITYHYDGTTWQTASNGTRHYLYSVMGTGSNDVWAAGSAPTAFHFDGSTWRGEGASDRFSIRRALAAKVESGAWLLNTIGRPTAWRQSLERWDGASWRVVSFTTAPEMELRDLYLLPAGQLWGVGRRVVRFQ